MDMVQHLLEELKEKEKYICELFNKTVAVGAPVVKTDDMGEKHYTVTTSPAWMVGNTAVVSLNGTSGGYACSRILPGKE